MVDSLIDRITIRLFTSSLTPSPFTIALTPSPTQKIDLELLPSHADAEQYADKIFIRLLWDPSLNQPADKKGASPPTKSQEFVELAGVRMRFVRSCAELGGVAEEGQTAVTTMLAQSSIRLAVDLREVREGKGCRGGDGGECRGSEGGNGDED